MVLLDCVEYLADERCVFVCCLGCVRHARTKICAPHRFLWRLEDEEEWLEKGVGPMLYPAPGARGARDRR